MSSPQSSTLSDDAANDGENRTLELLRRLQSSLVDPKTIAVADRRQVVAYLLGDGYSTADMAQIFKVSDRSIERDKKAIRETNAVERDPKLVTQMVGRLMGEAELSVQQIRKAVRDKDASPGDKIDANHRCYQILSDLTQNLQRLGYLPTAAQKVEADLTHHAGEIPDFAALRVETIRLKQAARETGQPDGVTAQVCELERLVDRAQLATQAETLSSELGRIGEGDDCAK